MKAEDATILYHPEMPSNADLFQNKISYIFALLYQYLNPCLYLADFFVYKAAI